MDNYAIAEQLELLSKLMDIHGENAFKAKSYATAAFTIEKLPQQLSTLSSDRISSIRGIGESVGKKVLELLETGELSVLSDLIARTPKGVLEMMNIKGLGPKKIHILWKESNISTIDELKEACQQNRIAEKKGFGEKTQQKILEAIHFQQQNTGRYLYAQVEPYVEALQLKLQEKFKGYKIEITGDFRRQLEIIDFLEWVTTIPKEKLFHFFNEEGFELLTESTDKVEWSSHDALRLVFHITDENQFHHRLFITTGSTEFILSFEQKNKIEFLEKIVSEETIFQQHNLPYIHPCLREKAQIISKIQQSLPSLIQINEIKGLIHAHSNWSDGAFSIEDMANELIHLGFEYLIISDHSKAAFYANGLSEQRIIEQHNLIDELNQKLAPFKIFKGIECDILSDGSLDYADDILSSFDLVITSIHSNLDMAEEKAMQRLLGAISNPYTTILGHMTGRILLKRKGYPIDHKTIIDACVAHNVVIEINSSPYRLDMDWRWIEYALERNVLLSINPDAHAIDEFSLIKYGILVSQKGGLTKERNLSSFSRNELEAFLEQQRNKRTKKQSVVL